MKMNEESWSALKGELRIIGLYNNEMIPALQAAIERGQDNLAYRLRRMEGEDVTDYTLHFNLQHDGEMVKPEKYIASIRATHPVGHSTVEGIDTAALEKRMAANQWDKDDALSGATPGLPNDQSEVSLIVQDMRSLLGSGNPEAIDIGERLAARYWLHTPMENVVDLSAAAARFDRQHEFSLEDPMIAISADKARNLLLGRSVATYADELLPSWSYLAPEATGKDRVVNVLGYLPGEQLLWLPIVELLSPEGLVSLMEKLMAGDNVPVGVKTGAGIEQLYLRVNAAEKELVLSDNTGKSLPLENYRKQEQTQSIMLQPENEAQQKKKGMHL